MKNPSIRFLARRYLKGRSKGPISPAHYLTLAGIALGVMALVCVSSVMNGFQTDMQDRLIGSQSEMRIRAKDGASITDYGQLITHLEEMGFAAAPVIRSELLIKRGTLVMPSLAFGVDPALHKEVSQIFSPAALDSDEMGMGILSGTADSLQSGPGGIILGVGLAYQMQVSVGDKVQVLSPMFDQPTAFGMIPKIRQLTVQAIVSSGMPEYDQSHSYIPLQTAAFFAGKGSAVDYLEIKTPDRRRTRAYSSQLSKAFPDYEIEDWSVYDPSLFAAMRFEKFLMFVIMLFMYIIASFNLTGNMLKSISLKKKELGLLKAIGYVEGDLSRLFLGQSLILATIGIFAGMALATVILGLQMHFSIIQLPISSFESIPLPVKIQVTDLLMVLIISYTFTIFSTLVPLKRLRQINPVELIRQTA